MPSYFIRVPAQDNTLNFKALYRAFEDIYSQLHTALRGQTIAFEILLSAQNISCYFYAAEDIADIISTQIFSFLPDAEITKVADPLAKFKSDQTDIYEFVSNKGKYFQIKSAEESDADPLVKLISYFVKLNKNDQILFQLKLSPWADSLPATLAKTVYKTYKKVKDSLLLRKIWNNADLSFEEKMFAEKFSKPLFQLSYHVLFANSPEKQLSSLAINDALSAYNSIKYSSLKAIKCSSEVLATLINRQQSAALILTAAELSLLFHIPSPSELPGLMQVLSRKQPPPSNLPTNGADVCWFGQTTYRGQNHKFGIKRSDRRRHLYVVGKSGVGKSKLMELLASADILAGEGLAVIDPHGDLVDNILNLVPPERVKDVVIFDPSDVNNPPVFNPFANVSKDFKLRVTVDFIEVFKKLFGSNWTPRIEHLLRYTCLALLDTPDSTILSIPKLFTDKHFRHSIIQNIEEEHVRHFWINEFAAWSEKYDAETVTPLLNKIGQFVSTDLIRNIFVHPENRFNFREIMDQKKILLVKISKGILGEENAALLGAMLITTIYQAAMSRADQPEHKRIPFNFYVDEFQNFATRTFAEILSESRKYGLSLTIANQYLGQLDSHIRSTLMGNVSSFIVFRLGADDAKILENEFSPAFTARDLINLSIREFCIKMLIDGDGSSPFSGRTLKINYLEDSQAQKCLELSRQKYNLPVNSIKSVSTVKANKDFEAPII